MFTCSLHLAKVSILSIEDLFRMIVKRWLKIFEESSRLPSDLVQRLKHVFLRTDLTHQSSLSIGQCSLAVVLRLLRCRSRLQTRERRRVRCSFDECLASSIFFRATIAEELAELGLGDLVIFVRRHCHRSARCPLVRSCCTNGNGTNVDCRILSSLSCKYTI